MIIESNYLLVTLLIFLINLQDNAECSTDIVQPMEQLKVVLKSLCHPVNVMKEPHKASIETSLRSMLLVYIDFFEGEDKEYIEELLSSNQFCSNEDDK